MNMQIQKVFWMNDNWLLSTWIHAYLKMTHNLSNGRFNQKC